MSMMINFDRKYNIITEEMITFMAFLRLMGIHIVAVVKAIWRSQLMLLCNICLYDGTRSINMALPCLMYRLLPYSQLHFYLFLSVSLWCYIFLFYLIIFTTILERKNTTILKNITTILKKKNIIALFSIMRNKGPLVALPCPYRRNTFNYEAQVRLLYFLLNYIFVLTLSILDQ